MTELKTDILIVGGGTGGVAAAIAATARGHHVILTEQYAWLGGQLTSQAVPPDENEWITTGSGGTRRYCQYRRAVQQYYRDHLPLTAKLRHSADFNPGGGGVSRLCHNPRISAAVFDQMLASTRASGRLTVLQPALPTAVDTQGDKVTGVTIEHLQTGKSIYITASYVIDATELGDLLALSNTEYVSGAESRKDTGELHAVDGPAEPDNVQAFTWDFAMGFDPRPDANHVIDKPATYDFWRDYTPSLTPPWPGKLLSTDHLNPVTLATRRNYLFAQAPSGDGIEGQPGIWNYRKVQTPENFDVNPPVHGVTIVNWPMNDYMAGNIIDQPADQVAKHLEASRQLSLSLLYWLQTEAVNPVTGEAGYRGLYLRPDFTGTPDGMAQAPYIRESRRIKAVFTVTEAHVGSEMRWTRKEPFDAMHGRRFDPMQGPICENFTDSVGIGYYPIDLHPSSNGRNYVDVASTPFQIPLGALLPVRVKNLLPGCKNLGVTHITNGCYRLHPVEWNIGEAAGVLASWCIEHGHEPHQVRANKKILRAFQAALEAEGIILHWPWQHHPSQC